MISLYILLLWLLLICGDIEPNPGPERTPEISEKTLSIFHGNIRSLRNKLNYIVDIIEDYDVVFLTETHLDSNITDSDLYISGFEIPVRKDRNSHGGGIIMYYKSYVRITRRHDLENCQLESMWFELKTKLRSILININYRSERQSSVYFWQYFDQMLKNALDENNNIICLGDLNKNFMSDLPSNIRDIFFISGLVNIIDKATHFDTRTGSTSLLDPILVTDSIPVLDKDTIPFDRGISDHDGTYVTINCGFSKRRTYNRSIWDYKKGDYDLMKQKVVETNWEYLISDASDVHVAATNFTNSFLNIASECIPTREVTIRCDDKVWYDSNLRRETRKRDRLRNIFIRSNSASAEKKFKQQRNKVNNLKKQAKKYFFTSINENLDELKVTNCKQYWKTVNMLIKSDTPSHDLPPMTDPDHNFKLAYEGTEKSDILNKYFCSISNLDGASKDLPEFDDRCLEFISQIVVSEQDVLDILSTLDVNKAVGPDIVSNRMLLAVRNEISKPLCLLFNKSLNDKIFPDQWKIAHVIPLFKSGDKSLPSNYRPVSLLSCVSKVLEKIVFKNIFNHLHGNKLLYKYQSGFIPGYSTSHQLIELYNKILSALNEKLLTSITFADISKAFDTVWIKALLHKLEKYGIKGDLLCWLTSYLSRRSQRVVIKDSLSNIGKLNAGVPQGSVLGPLLFLIYINDIADGMSGFGRLFADDTSIGHTAPDESTLKNSISRDLDYLSKWSEKWLVKFNPNKTDIMIFSLKNIYSDITFDFGGATLKPVSPHKHLGVIFSNGISMLIN